MSLREDFWEKEEDEFENIEIDKFAETGLA